MTDWTLDCLLDWVFGQDDLPESVEHHHDRLRADMERAVTDADLRAVVNEWGALLDGVESFPTEQAAVDRLRAVLGEQG